MPGECCTQCELCLGEKKSQIDEGLPAEDIEWSCCWCFRENLQQGRRLCSLSVYHWQRAAACVIDSLTNQSSCSSTKHQGPQPVYSLNRPKHTGHTGWLPQLPLPLLNKLPFASVSLYAPSFLPFFSLSPLSYHLIANTFSSLLKHTVWSHEYRHGGQTWII